AQGQQEGGGRQAEGRTERRAKRGKEGEGTTRGHGHLQEQLRFEESQFSAMECRTSCGSLVSWGRGSSRVHALIVRGPWARSASRDAPRAMVQGGGHGDASWRGHGVVMAWSWRGHGVVMVWRRG